MGKGYRYLMIALLLTAILIAYYQLGGFREPEITYVDVQRYRLAGTYYEGNLNDGRWEDLFTKTRNLITEEGMHGPLMILWYTMPNENDDRARAFIGIELQSGENQPESLELRQIRLNGAVQTTINAHNLVMPSPGTIVEKMKLYAEENGLVLQNILIEKYPGESVVISEIPVDVKIMEP